MATTQKVRWEADVSGLSRGQREANDLVERGASGMNRALSQASFAFKNLERSAKEYKQEQVQQGRLVGFYVREVAEFTGAGQQAQAVLGGFAQTLGEAATAGLGFGLAVEGVKLAVAAYNYLTADATEKLKKLGEAEAENLRKVAEAAEQARKEYLQLEAARHGWKGDSFDRALSATDTVNAAKNANAGKKRQLEEAQLEQLYWNGVESRWLNPVGVGIAAFKLRSIDAEVKQLTKDVAETGAEYDRLKDKFGVTADGRTLIENVKRFGGSGAFTRGSGDSAGITSTEIELTDKRIKEATEKAKAFRKEWETVEETLARMRESHAIEYLIPAQLGEAEKRVRYQSSGFGSQGDILNLQSVREKQQDQNLAEYQRKHAGETDSFSAGQGRAFAMQGAVKAEREVEYQQEKEKKRLKDLEESWVKYGDAAGQALAGLVAGEKTLGQTVAAVAAAGLRSVLGMIRNEILADQVRAAMKAFAAHQGVPFVGLALGAAAAAAAFSFGDSLLGRLGSAEQGAVLPSTGRAFPFILHPNEWVLPQDKARGLDRLIKGGGAGGNTYVIQAMDARSFEDYLADNPRAFRNAQDRIARKGY